MSAVLVIDNYDSFTFNLVQLIAGRGEEVAVVRNDAETPAALLARRPAAIVLSPGPGRPEDAGVSVELIRRRPGVPLLGVCLGHQALGIAFGAEVGPARRLMHGKVSEVRHAGTGIFAGLPSPFQATRYHSLAVAEDSLPPELEAVAWGDDGSLQAMRHRELPYWGVQFHPESILTARGPELIEGFLRLRGGRERVA
ncbi:MAG: aminodeoxychorismate/anthranilate synthase component II [Thermoanaerobaculia bacterium]|nr:aminodeoxychorismate/anthranilate synthase component II [Thermoanaerobaculia bacterium]